MQSKLATWSTENKERKFDRLLRLIADRNWLSEAARITLVSSGARTPGVDGVDKRMMEGNLQTNRYWRIRQLHEDPVRPTQLVEAEIRQQTGWLQALRDDLQLRVDRIDAARGDPVV